MIDVSGFHGLISRIIKIVSHFGEMTAHEILSRDGEGGDNVGVIK
jgi:hypothetical protein